MYYKLLKEGDSILSINDKFVAVERFDGSVDMYPIFKKNGKICIDTKSKTTIGISAEEVYGEVIEDNADNCVKILQF